MYQKFVFYIVITAGCLMAACSAIGSDSCTCESTSGPPTTAAATDDEGITLNWKLAEGEVIAYRTALDPVEQATSEVEIDAAIDDPSALDAMLQQLINVLGSRETSITTLMQLNNRGNIGVKMFFDETDTEVPTADDPFTQSLNQLMQNMQGTVQLRGELTPAGDIASFYLQQNQRNLLAIFFQLPSQPVQVGDSWEIDVHCVSIGTGYIITEAARHNQVTLTAIEETSTGERMAILDYLIAESITGNTDAMISPQEVPTSMRCSFVGQGQFLIDAGRWHQFTGELAIGSSGMMNTNNVQHLALFPLDEVPPEYSAID